MIVTLKSTLDRPRHAVQRLRGRGFALSCGVLAVVSASESVRLILQGETQGARWSGWYLLVVSALVVSGALTGADTNEPAPSVAEDRVVDGTAAGDVQDPPADPTSYTREAVTFFVAAFVFAWALPWVGFAVANGVFVAVYLLFIDHRRWYVAIALAVVVDACLVVGMDRLNVLLPAGVLGLGL